MTNTLPTIAGFWYGSDLSWLEALCIRSFLDNGHRFVLYVAHPVDGVPEGTDIRPATDVYWPPPFDLADNDRQRVAVFSDIFRLKLCQQTDFIWVDLDAYCVRPFDFDSPYVFAPTGDGSYPNGVLRLPSDSATLTQMLAFITSENPTQPWRGARLHRINRKRVRNGETWGIEALPWACSGPKALSHFLRKTREDRRALPSHALYPLAVEDLWKLHDTRIRMDEIERAGVYSVHIYGHQKKWVATQRAGLPLPGSYLERLCQRHAVDPALNPIQQLEWMRPKT